MHTQHITEDGGSLYIALPSSMIMLSRWYKTQEWYLGVCQSHSGTNTLDHQFPISHATRQLTCDSQNCTHHQISKISFKSLQESPQRHKSHCGYVCCTHPTALCLGKGLIQRTGISGWKYELQRCQTKSTRQKDLLRKAGGEIQPDSLCFPTGPGSRHSSAVCADTDATFFLRRITMGENLPVGAEIWTSALPVPRGIMALEIK